MEDIKLKGRLNTENTEVLMKERDALESERQRLRDQCGNSDLLSEEIQVVVSNSESWKKRDNLVIGVATIDSQNMERDVLRIETENL
jgi:hypothetical protein